MAYTTPPFFTAPVSNNGAAGPSFSQPHHQPIPLQLDEAGFENMDYRDAFYPQGFEFDIPAPQQQQQPQQGQQRQGQLQGQLPTPGSQTRSLSPNIPSPGEAGRDKRGSSEEKELTPGQRRRKEQNRAAQRAFRERKERHVKDLETRLAALEATNSTITSENASLKAALEKAKLENQLLYETRDLTARVRPSTPPIVHGPFGFTPTNYPQKNNGYNHQYSASIRSGSTSSTTSTSPQTSSTAATTVDFDAPPPPSTFIGPLFKEHPNKGPIHRITTSPKTGERLLGAGAAWDLIICHPLYQQGLVDIADISDRLKGLALCDGQGPVFEESTIYEAIHASSGSGVDELIPDDGDWC